jgi:A1 cistron-splicing factor AAR2
MIPAGAPEGAEGGILIVLGMPKESEFGIDMKTWEVGPNFRGIVGIPLGLHLITFGTGAGLRQGFFVEYKRPQEVIIKSWDPANEEIIEQGTGLTEEAINHLLESLRRGQLAAHLAPYPEGEQGRLWRNLINCIDMRVLERAGLTLDSRVVPGEWEEEKLAAKGRANTQQQEEVVPYFPGLGRAARFTEVLGQRRPRGQGQGQRQGGPDPAEVTRFNLDYSVRLEELLEGEYGGDWRLLVGEYQLAFVLFLDLLSMGGLRFWKEATALLCGCDEALASRPGLFTAFVRILFTQVKVIPDDFFEDEAHEGSFLAPALARLVGNVRSRPGLAEELCDHVDRFVKLMKKRFRGLDLDEEALQEDEDEKPVVVPIDEVERAMRVLTTIPE